MKKVAQKLFVLTLIALFSVGCGETASYYDSIDNDPSGILRGINVNDKVEDIKAKEEAAALMIEEEDMLEYEYPLKKEDSYVVTYSLDDMGVYEITLATYFELKEEAIKVKDGLKSKYDAVYGAPSDEDDFYRWESDDGAIAVELDYVNIEEGQVMLIIMANE